MATKAQAREKFINSVTSDLALEKMTSKLSEYLGMSVDINSGPVKAWQGLMSRAAGEVFDKCYANMQAAYRR